MRRVDTMDAYDVELLRRIEQLIKLYQKFVLDAEDTPQEESLVNGLRGLVCLANMVLKQEDVFGIEPWHILSKSAPLSMPGEMLLRLKDHKGKPMPPYPIIMAFYNTGYTAQIDGILFLAALTQFARESEKLDGERQVSINISARSLRDPDFVRMTISRLESLKLRPDQKIIIEIHESSPHLSMSRQVLELYRTLGIEFAIDDVGLNMSDVLRLSEFDDLASYIKIDRHSVCAPEGQSNSLKEVVNFLRTLLPDAVMVAEGVKDAAHAYELAQAFPDILYAQGLYLPSAREKFSLDYYNVAAKAKNAAGDEMQEHMPGDSKNMIDPFAEKV